MAHFPHILRDWDETVQRHRALSNGNTTEWSPIRAVIMRVITKSQWESDLFITSLITDGIGRHEILLPTNHRNCNFREKEKS